MAAMMDTQHAFAFLLSLSLARRVIESVGASIDCLASSIGALEGRTTSPHFSTERAALKRG